MNEKEKVTKNGEKENKKHRKDVLVRNQTLNFVFCSPIMKCALLLTLWTPRVYFESPPTKPNCLRMRQP